MKKILLFIQIFIITLVFSQKKFDLDYEAYYSLKYKKSNATSFKRETTFTLLINRNSSYFKNINKYIADSLEVEKIEIPLSESMKYVTDFPQTIGTTEARLFITDEINYVSYDYEEPNKINWKVKNEFKTVAGYKCQKAETRKYGRTWTAWFTKDIPFPFGPYKFNGLPGLITEIYDTNDDYHYTIYAFLKGKRTCRSANIAVKAKKTTKEKFVEAYKNRLAGKIQLHQQYIENKEDIEFMRKNAVEAEKNYNPIELSIY